MDSNVDISKRADFAFYDSVRREVVKDLQNQYKLPISTVQEIVTDDLLNVVIGKMWNAQEEAIETIGRYHQNLKEQNENSKD